LIATPHYSTQVAIAAQTRMAGTSTATGLAPPGAGGGAHSIWAPLPAAASLGVADGLSPLGMLCNACQNLLLNFVPAQIQSQGFRLTGRLSAGLFTLPSQTRGKPLPLPGIIEARGKRTCAIAHSGGVYLPASAKSATQPLSLQRHKHLAEIAICADCQVMCSADFEMHDNSGPPSSYASVENAVLAQNSAARVIRTG